MYEQLSLFDAIYAPEPEMKRPKKILSVGDKIGKVVLGECRIATITKVEGLPNYPFYRTDRGICYSVSDGEKSIDELLSIAEQNRKKYKTIIPQNLSERFTVEYEPRECDGAVLWAQEDVEYYLRMKYREGNSTVSLNNKRRKLNALFEWMRKGGMIIRNPVESTEKFSEIMKPIDHMGPEEVDQLKTGCKTKRDRALLEWMRCTATRKGEIPDVKISQVDWQKGQVMIYGSKGRAYRIVCLDSVALKYLREYINERGVDLMSDQPLFTHCRGDMQKALSKSGIYSEIKRIAANSGITRRVYPHLFRKTTATNILKRGGTDSDAGEYLGHKPQGVTARHYAFRSEDHTVKIFESFVAMI